MLLVLVAIILLKAVPAFADFYGTFDRPLPLSTRMIMAVSGAAVANFWLIIAVLVVGGFVFFAWSRQPTQRALLDRVLLEVPWAGPTTRKFVTAQTARMLSTLLGGGIPLVNALEIGVRSLGNRHIALGLDEVRRRVQEGQSFAVALRARDVFPDVAVKMVEVGESTGALQDMLNSLAEFYDEEIETDVDRVTRLIEPVLLVVMGAVIALVVLAMYMPLFDLSSVVGT
jgi:type IV pilus assembly protein PilC